MRERIGRHAAAAAQLTQQLAIERATTLLLERSLEPGTLPRCPGLSFATRYVAAEGRLITAGGPTVKNVTGYDLPRLFVGSLGTIGVLQQATLRCRISMFHTRARSDHSARLPSRRPNRARG